MERATWRGRWQRLSTTVPLSRAPQPKARHGHLRWSLRLVGVALLVVLGAAALTPGRETGAQAPMPHDHTTHSHVAAPNDATRRDKASPNAADPCAKGNLKRLETLGLCTHGPDPAPPGFDIQTDVAPVLGTSDTAATVSCDGDGTTGNRVEVIYARASDVPSRYLTYLPSFRQWVADADQIYRASAAQTGGSRRIRFVHDANCAVVVHNVTVSPTGDDTFTNTVTELKNLGFNRTDRKYVIFMDANVLCGIGNIQGDMRRDGANRNNAGPSYGRTDVGCWGGRVVAHELMHNLGGVQNTAPNTGGGWHCVDEYDVMCYSDSPNYPAMRYACPDSAQEYRLDCGKDDYYHTSPPAGSYLAEGWNAANSRFLVGAVDQPPLPPPANDDILTAQPASARPYTEKRTVYSATTAAGDPRPSCYSFSVQQSVWYTTTPATSGTLIVDTFGSPYDTVLAVFTGSPGSLTEAACNDDAGTSQQSKVEVAVTAGTTYFVMVIPYYSNGASWLALRVDGPAETLAPTGAPVITLSKEKSKYNGWVTATLGGFAPGSTVTLRWPRPYEVTSGPTKSTFTDVLATTTADGSGVATASFRTPLEPLGDYTVTASDGQGQTAIDTLRVIPRILLNEVEGPVTTTLRVYFYGFLPDERVEVRWHLTESATSSYVVVKTLTIADNGRGSSLITIPVDAELGKHLIVGKVIGVSRSASTPFTVTAPLSELTSTATPTVEATATPTESAAELPSETPSPTEMPTTIPTDTPVPTETAVPNASPVADAGDDQVAVDEDGSGDEPITLDGTGSTDPEGGALTYSWREEGIEFATGPSPPLTLPVGIHTLTLLVTDDQGAQAVDEVVITVEAGAPSEEPAPTDGESGGAG